MEEEDSHRPPPTPPPSSSDTEESTSDRLSEDQLLSLLGGLQLGSQQADEDEPTQPLLDSFDVEGVARFLSQDTTKRVIVMCGAGISVSAGREFSIDVIPRLSVTSRVVSVSTSANSASI